MQAKLELEQQFMSLQIRMGPFSKMQPDKEQKIGQTQGKGPSRPQSAGRKKRRSNLL